MKASHLFSLGSALLASVLARAQESTVKVIELSKVGISSELLTRVFYKRTGVQLDPNELISVSEAHEGSKFKFETMDRISINVNLASVRGPYNKTN